MRTSKQGQRSEEEIPAWLESLPRYRNGPLKSLWSRLKFFLNIVYCRILGLQRPLFVVLVTNNRCNLSCRYCYGGYGKRHEYSDYSTAELVSIIDQLWDLGTRNLTVHGGESLLRADIGHLLNYMKLKGFYVSLNTNGILVPRRISEISSVDTICVSLDGTEEGNDRNRGKGTFLKVMEAITVIRQQGIPLTVSATLTRHNRNDMEFLARKASELGFSLFYSILYNPGELAPEEILSEEEVREVTRKIKSLKEQGYPVFYSDRVLEAVLTWPFAFSQKSFMTAAELRENCDKAGQVIPCYHGALKFQIDADGRVISCWGHDDSDAPNIRELGVAGAIEECRRRKDCACCAFMANNEHNLLLGLSFRTIADLAAVQIRDAFKIRKRTA